MAQIDELLIKISADIKSLEKAMADATKVTKSATDKMQDSVEKAGKAGDSAFSKFGGAAQIAAGNLIASGITKIVGAIGNAARVAGQDFLEFNKAIAEVNSILPQNAKLTQDATNQFVKFAASFGSTSQQQAKAYYDIVSSGFADVSTAMNILNTANKAAVAGVTDVNTAVKGLTSVLNVFGGDAFDASTAADILFKTVQQGVTTFPQLASTLGNVTSIAKAAGLSFDELAGTVGFLTTKGIGTAEAVTSLRGLLVGLSAPTEAAAKAAKEMGVVLGTSATQNGNFSKTIERIIEVTGGQLSEIRKLIPEVEAAKAVAAIASGEFRNFTDALAGTKNSANAATLAFKEVEKSASFQFDKLTASLRALPQLFLNVQSEGIAVFLTSLNDHLPAAIAATLTGIGYFVAGIDGLIRVAEDAAETVGSLASKIGNYGLAVGQFLSGNWSMAADTISEIDKASQESADKVKKIWSENTVLSDLGVALIQSAEEARNFGKAFEEAAKPPVALNAGLVQTQEELAKASQMAIDFVSALTGAKNPEGENADAMKALETQLEAELITREQFAEERRSLLEQQLAAEAALTDEFIAARQLKDEEAAEIRNALEERSTMQRLELANKENAEKKRLKEQEFRNLQSTLGDISSLSSAKNKELAAVGKAAGIAQATIKTYEAANVALASAPPPFNFALAGAVVAAGLVNVAKISGTQLQSGIDSVPGIGFKDNFPAILAPGERVVPRETNQDLTKFLNEGRNNSQPTVVNVNINISGDFFESDDANIKLVERIQDTLKITGLNLA